LGNQAEKLPVSITIDTGEKRLTAQRAEEGKACIPRVPWALQRSLAAEGQKIQRAIAE
jgi:hypothetical protein